MNLGERRHDSRTKLQHLAYISFNSGNGAIVLDVSQGGLAFRAAAPLESNELIRFHVPGNTGSRVEVTAELAWKDKTKKSGGLRFLTLPQEFRQQVLVSLGHPTWNHAAEPVAIPYSGHSLPNAVRSQDKSSSPTNGPKPRLQSKTFPADKRVVTSRARLGSRFLIALALGLFIFNCLAMFAVSRSIQGRFNQEAINNSQASLIASRAVFSETEVMLKHKVELLSALVAMTPSDDAALQNSIDDSLISDGTDFLAVMDGATQIIALSNTDQNMTIATAQGIVLRALSDRATPQWWLANSRLYEVVVRAQDNRALASNSGTIIVARQMDDKIMGYLKTISAGDVAFTYSGEVVASTLKGADQAELSQRLSGGAGSQEVRIGERSFDAASMNLENGSGPALLYTILKPAEQRMGFMQSLNRILFRLGEIEILLLIGFTAFEFARRKSAPAIEDGGRKALRPVPSK